MLTRSVTSAAAQQHRASRRGRGPLSSDGPISQKTTAHVRSRRSSLVILSGQTAVWFGVKLPAARQKSARMRAFQFHLFKNETERNEEGQITFNLYHPESMKIQLRWGKETAGRTSKRVPTKSIGKPEPHGRVARNRLMRGLL